jgi:hypothetical protein
MVALKIVERRHELLHCCGELFLRRLRVLHRCGERCVRFIQLCEEHRLRVIYPCEERRLRVIHPCDEVVEPFVMWRLRSAILVGGEAVVIKLSVGVGELFIHGGAPCVEVF